MFNVVKPGGKKVNLQTKLANKWFTHFTRASLIVVAFA